MDKIHLCVGGAIVVHGVMGAGHEDVGSDNAMHSSGVIKHAFA